MCMLRPSFMLSAMSLCKCRFTVGEQFPPCRMGGVSAHSDRDSIPNGSPNRIKAGDALVSKSIEFLYTSMARWNLSTSKDLVGPVLSVSMRFTVLTASSALQLACGLATDVRLCLTPHDFRKVCVFPEVNCGPPSDVNSSGMYQKSQKFHGDV